MLVNTCKSDINSDNLVIDIDHDPNFDSRSATNELPLSAIKFSSCSQLFSSYDDYDLPMSDAYDLILHNTRPKISPLATNEKPLSLTPLTFVGSPPPPPSSSSATSDFVSDPFKDHHLGNSHSPSYFPSFNFPQTRSLSCEDVFTNSVLANGSTTARATVSSASSMYITSPFEFNSFNFYQHERNLRFGRIYSSSCETSLHKCASVDMCPSPGRRNSASYASFYSFPGLIGNSTPPLHVTGNSSKADLLLTGDPNQHTCDEITIELTVASRTQSNESIKDNILSYHPAHVTHVSASVSHPPAICINSQPYSSFEKEGDEDSSFPSVECSANQVVVVTPTLPQPKLDDNTTTIDIACLDNQNNQLTNVCPLTKQNQQRDQSQSCVIAASPIVVCCVSNNNEIVAATATITKPPIITTTSTTPTSSSKTSDSPQSGSRRQRHSIASGQMGVFKSLGYSRKMAASTNSLFSTAVISGSSSAPNLRDMIPSTATPSGKVLSKFINAHHINIFVIKLERKQ